MLLVHHSCVAVVVLDGYADHWLMVLVVLLCVYDGHLLHPAAVMLGNPFLKLLFVLFVLSCGIDDETNAAADATTDRDGDDDNDCETDCTSFIFFLLALLVCLKSQLSRMDTLFVLSIPTIVIAGSKGS